MIFDGKQFRVCRRVVVLPREYWYGEQKNYVAFGRTCKASTPEAIKTNQIWVNGGPYGDEKENGIWPVYAKQILRSGHSLTNLMYGTDSKAYLFYKGKVYSRRTQMKRN